MDIYNRRRNLVFIGDSAVGKTSLIIVIAHGADTSTLHYIPSIIENSVINVEIKGEPIKLALWDTAARADYEFRLRPLGRVGVHAFLLCFSVDEPDSLDNAGEKWISEIHEFYGSIPCFLVACKKDLRYNPEVIQNLVRFGQAPVSYEQGVQMAQLLDVEYLECSAKTGEGVRELLLQVTETMDEKIKILNRRHRRRSGCIIM